MEETNKVTQERLQAFVDAKAYVERERDALVAALRARLAVESGPLKAELRTFEQPDVSWRQKAEEYLGKRRVENILARAPRRTVEQLRVEAKA